MGTAKNTSAALRNAALRELEDIAREASAARQRRIEDLRGDQAACPDTLNIFPFCEFGRGYLHALRTAGILSAEQEAQWWGYMAGNAPFPAPVDDHV